MIPENADQAARDAAADLVRLIDERIAGLQAQRRLLMTMLADTPEAKPTQADESVAWPALGRAAAIVVDALVTASGEGLLGRVLNERVMETGLSLDAAEKAKSRLRSQGILVVDPTTRHWSITPAYRSSLPHPSRGSVPGPRLRPVGPGARTAILVAIRELGSEATMTRIVATIEGEVGLSPRTLKRAMLEMRAAGDIVRANGVWKEARAKGDRA